jgi:GT2 family glycosyltransferase
MIPTVSVVVPSFNRAALLVPTVESLLAQSRAPLEIIIVDDGSTDETPAVCARFPAPVRAIRQPNGGLPAARNTGIRAARGEWIAFCDSDDLWHPAKLEVQLAALEAAGPGHRWCLTGCTLIDPDGAPVPLDRSGFEEVFPVFEQKRIDPESHFTPWLRSRTVATAGGEHVVFVGDAFGLLFEGNVGLPSSSIVARSLLDEAGLFDESFRCAEETEFFHRLAAAAPVAIVMTPLVDYRVGHASIVSDPASTVRLKENALVSLERAARLRPTLTAAERAACRRGTHGMRMRLAYARLSTLDTAGARAALWPALRERPSPRAGGILLASLLPAPALRGLHWLKRAISA